MIATKPFTPHIEKKPDALDRAAEKVLMDTTTTAQKTITGPDGNPLPIGGSLVLSVERVTHPYKYYKLIWVNGKAWDCREHADRYRKVNGSDGVIEAGEKLAKELGVKFDGRVR